MDILDISVGLHKNIPVWPGESHFFWESTASIDAGDGVNVSRISCGVHTGTHVDAPRHVLTQGPTVERLALEALVGPTYVVEIMDREEITARDLEALCLGEGVERLLVRTRNSRLWEEGVATFQKDFVALTAEAAEWVVDAGIKLIGVDYLSVQRFRDPEPTTHRILLEAGTVIVEGLDLSNVAAGRYELVCLPLKLVGAEGAPARAILIKKSTDE